MLGLFFFPTTIMFLNVVNLVVQETVMVVPYTGSVHIIFAPLQNIVMFYIPFRIKRECHLQWQHLFIVDLFS